MQAGLGLEGHLRLLLPTWLWASFHPRGLLSSSNRILKSQLNDVCLKVRRARGAQGAWCWFDHRDYSRVEDLCASSRRSAEYIEIQACLSNSLMTHSLAQMLQLWTAFLTATCHFLPFRSITCCSLGVQWEELSSAKAESPMEGTLLAPGLWPSLQWPPCGSPMPWLPIRRAHFQNSRIKADIAYCFFFFSFLFLMYFSCAAWNCIRCYKVEKKGDMVGGRSSVMFGSQSCARQTNCSAMCRLITHHIRQRKAARPKPDFAGGLHLPN